MTNNCFHISHIKHNIYKRCSPTQRKVFSITYLQKIRSLSEGHVTVYILYVFYVVWKILLLFIEIVVPLIIIIFKRIFQYIYMRLWRACKYNHNFIPTYTHKQNILWNISVTVFFSLQQQQKNLFKSLPVVEILWVVNHSLMVKQLQIKNYHNK